MKSSLLSRSAGLPFAAALIACLAFAPQVRAGEKGYGLALGLVTPLSPSDTLGAAVGLSAFATGLQSGPSTLLRARGEVLGLFTEDSKAALPTLTGEVGLSRGRLDLFVLGGVQLFGVAWRQDYTVFAVFGLLGGAGLGINVTPRLRVGVRAAVTWLPDRTTAILDSPESGSKPTYLFLHSMVTVELIPAAGPSGPGPDSSVPEL